MHGASELPSKALAEAAVLACTPVALALRAVHGRPLLCYLLDELDSLGLSQCILCTEDGGAVAGVFGERYRGIKLCYCPASARAETAGKAGNAKAPERASLAGYLRQAFVLCDGKSVLAVRGLPFLSEGLGAFAAQCATSEASAVLAATRDGACGGRLSSAGICRLKLASWQSAGLAATLLAADTLDAIPPERLCVLVGACLDPAADSACTEAFLKSRSAKGKAVFLDRDGTVNVDKNYLYKPEDLELIEGMPAFIALWRRWGYRIIVVTNQSGIARGYYGEEDMERLHACMNEKLAHWGAHVDAFYHCPHHPGITGPCGCRKPKPGLLEKAVFDFNLDPSQCLLFGDKDSDILAGQACGVFAVKVR